ncbi:multidrug resistance-associated protein 5 [Tanacetum coccineum]
MRKTWPNVVDNSRHVEQNDASDSDLDDDDYNIYEYDSESEESDTASVDHLSDGEEEIYDTRTRQPDPKPKKMRTYAAEILNSNPGSTCKMSVDSMPDGELLSAVGRDGNNQIYPIAWAVVSVENKDNWVWFMELLISDLSLPSGQGLTIISDQHKDDYKNTLMDRHPESWSRAYFTTDKACDAVENGISEYQRMREKHEKWNDGICPNIKKKLEKCKDDHRFWKVIASGQTSFEVRNGYEGFKPMNEMDQWPSTTYQKQLPPIKRRMPGRPPHKRKRDAIEDDGENRTRIMVLWNCRGGSVTARGGKVTARGGSVTARGGKVTVRGALWCLREGECLQVGEIVVLQEGEMQVLGVGNASIVVSSRVLPMRGLGTVRRMYPHGSGTIEILVYPGRIQLMVRTMLGDSMGIPRPAWPEGITPQDCIIEAATQSEIAISQSPPVESQEQEAPMQENSTRTIIARTNLCIGDTDCNIHCRNRKIAQYW